MRTARHKIWSHEGEDSPGDRPRARPAGRPGQGQGPQPRSAPQERPGCRQRPVGEAEEGGQVMAAAFQLLDSQDPREALLVIHVLLKDAGGPRRFWLFP